jgi:hypothetical protein
VPNEQAISSLNQVKEQAAEEDKDSFEFEDFEFVESGNSGE